MISIFINSDPGNSLGGSCNRDIKNMMTYVRRKYSCKIYVMIRNISQIKDIIINMKSGDTLFVLITGHGYQTVDKNGDESDGRDEYINTSFGRLLDDQLHDIFLFRKDIKVIAIFDTCHSGTLFDLPYKYDGKWSKETDKKCICDNVMTLGACRDNQSENCDIGINIGFGGALIIHMIENDLIQELINMEINKFYFKIKKILKIFGQTPIIQINKI